MVEAIQQGIIPRQFEIFAGLDVDKSRIAVTFTDHESLLKSLQMPYSSEHCSTIWANILGAAKSPWLTKWGRPALVSTTI